MSSKMSGASHVFLIISSSSLSSNGRNVVNMAYIMQPSDQRSQELLYGSEQRISGAAYPSVPNGSCAF